MILAPDLPATLSSRELCDALGITDAQRAAWRAKGLLPDFIPGTRRYRTSEVWDRLGLDPDGSTKASLAAETGKALAAIERWER
ncbi:MAG: hypothetical protein ACREFC_09600 [Stellaceae bacterium]